MIVYESKPNITLPEPSIYPTNDNVELVWVWGKVIPPNPNLSHSLSLTLSTKNKKNTHTSHKGARGARSAQTVEHQTVDKRGTPE